MNAFNKNFWIVVFFIALFIPFMTGCASPTDEKLLEEVPEQKEAFVSSADPVMLGRLRESLNTTILNYEASYTRERNYSWWGGRSGSSHWNEASLVFIRVRDGSITNYTIHHQKEGFAIDKQDYSEYYDVVHNKTCHQEIISESKCNLETLPPPAFGGALRGCRISLSGGGGAKCVCDNEIIPIEQTWGLSCSREKDTSNMKLRYGHAIYYPETKEGICYFEAEDVGNEELWAFECNQQPVELKSNISQSYYSETEKGFCYTILESKKTAEQWIRDCSQEKVDFEPTMVDYTPLLTDVKCYQYGYGCYCKFSPIKTNGCASLTPKNFDHDLKQRIIVYLNSIPVPTMTEEKDMTRGACYSFIYDKLQHTFCFDEQGLITFARWGKNIVNKYESEFVDINTVEKRE